ncbi:glycoside hydrolase [Dendrothele bispora CBS 962.96]|uniref:Glycoside hydrolase n=1 Tax=Dendrothele bispora (strain CBS 962.96) TaxID=1314807 RepID=A0A4S8LS28_DENBC|nr:glycoside hydrolase [Dendrothele bispora CBS 962.96]
MSGGSRLISWHWLCFVFVFFAFTHPPCAPGTLISPGSNPNIMRLLRRIEVQVNLPDRFAMPDGWFFSKLRYIRKEILRRIWGFDAIWISPVVQNVEGDTGVGEAYHGYWTSNINSINSHFGSSDDLKKLGSALNERGMYLMVDVVVNHPLEKKLKNPTSKSKRLAAIPTNTSNIYPSTFDYSTLQPFSGTTILKTPLIDLDTRKTHTNVGIMNDWVKNLVSEYSIDGLRIDTVKHVRKEFWNDFAESAGVYTIGEVLIDNTTYASPYIQLISSILHYPTYFAVFDAFFTSSTSSSGNGQKQGYQGGSDPDNREALWLSGYNTENKPLLSHVTKLNAAR